ncbi:MAG: hypothetical protein IJU34_00675 [Bacteroidales bacterium]|nr:hypothetical protein [Bacteroidales bacterium]
MSKKKLNDLKDLRFVRKDLEQPDDNPAGIAAGRPRDLSGQRRSKTVVHPSRAEEHARNEGLTRGQKVRMMDTNDTATLVGFGDGYYELDLDGLVIRAVRSEFILIDPEQDRKLYASIPAKVRKTEDPAAYSPSADGELTVDLHLERIPGSEGIPEWAALDFQMNYFRQTLRHNLRHKGRRIVFVHGIGDGVLAQAVRKELDEAFALSCSYTVGPMGTTIVTIR